MTESNTSSRKRKISEISEISEINNNSDIINNKVTTQHILNALATPKKKKRVN